MNERHAEQESWALLERYHDDALEPDERAALSERLRGDPALRARLQQVAALDRRIEQALLTPGSPTPAATVIRLRAWAALIGLVVIGAAAAYALTRTTAPPVPAPLPSMVASDEGPLRVVLSIPIPARTDAGDGAPAARPARPARPAPPAVLPAPPSLSEALVRGNVDAAMRLVDSAPAEGRAAIYARLGDAIRSASTAETILDQMSERDQLEACRAWAADPHMRPVTFRRLRRLAGSSSVADEVKILAERLSADPTLDAWVRSYGLASSATARTRSTSG